MRLRWGELGAANKTRNHIEDLVQKFKLIFPNQEESEKYGILGQGQREGEDDLKKAKRRQAMLGKGSEIY